MNKKKKSRNYSARIGKKNLDIKNSKFFNVQSVQMSNYLKNKIKIRPPFSPGLFSYSKSKKNISKVNKMNSRNIKNSNNFFLSNVYSIKPNYTKNSTTSKNNNYIKNILYSSINKKSNTKSLLLSCSTLNLNKYKLSTNESNKIRYLDSNEKQNINKFNNKSINLNINFNVEKNKSVDEKNTQIIPQYKNYFISSEKYQNESRRMLLEYIKILNKKEKNINNILKQNNISEKVLNQKFIIKGINNSNDSVQLSDKNFIIGEGKNYNYLNDLNDSFSEESKNELNYEDNNEPYVNIKNKYINFNKKNKFNYINSIKNQNNKKINIINFLFVPKVLNLVESKGKTEKYIFCTVPDESSFIKGEENYKFIWKNMVDNEIENEFKIDNIKECFINEKYKNRFIIKVQMDDYTELKFEIETPTNEVSEYYSYGINYLLKKLIRC